MPCSIYQFSSLTDAAALIEELLNREELSPNQENNTEELVKKIIAQVRSEGIKALVEFTQKFDSPSFTKEQFQVSPSALKSAEQSLSPDQKTTIEEAITHIKFFHEKQKQQSWFFHTSDMSLYGQRVLPLERVGIYVPGGTAGSTPLLSSLLMGAIPAQVAGVKELVVVSPPNKEGSVHPHILACASLLGIKEVYACGSAWAIAALAYGAGELKAVDLIAGPGNTYVTTAKRLLLGKVGIDALAGPSEILIIADEGANPSWVAADMLSQAEHDSLASAVCICFSSDFAQKVQSEIKKQLATLSREAIASKSLANFGAIIVVPTREVAANISNKIAPEHLELSVENPWDFLPLVTNAGAIFMGYQAAEAFGDYFAGPNHVLPTMGTARFSSALSVETFYKKSSLLFPSKEFAHNSAEKTALLARLENLEAHARSALLRKDI